MIKRKSIFRAGVLMLALSTPFFDGCRTKPEESPPITRESEESQDDVKKSLYELLLEKNTELQNENRELKDSYQNQKEEITSKKEEYSRLEKSIDALSVKNSRLEKDNSMLEVDRNIIKRDYYRILKDKLELEKKVDFYENYMRKNKI